jgi:hypothetical protein
MIINRTPGLITISLEDSDFKYYEWRAFLDEIKQIKGWEYDGDLKLWTIPDNPENTEKMNELYDKYFKDKNQIGLFT